MEKRSKSKQISGFPKMHPMLEPTPKMHGFLCHAYEQMRLLGCVGLLSESVVESVHVMDNTLIRRFACVRDLFPTALDWPQGSGRLGALALC